MGRLLASIRRASRTKSSCGAETESQERMSLLHNGQRLTRGGIAHSPRLRWMSTVPTSSRPVISRRVWQAHLQGLPKSPKAPKNKPDDKPWPRNVQIGAGVAASILVPYATVWFITSNPTLRESTGGILPLDLLRSHFGVLEWDAQSYADRNDEIPDGFYQYPLEWPFLVRKQQAIIEKASKRNITANIYTIGDSQRKEVKVLPASTRANEETLRGLLGHDGKSNTAHVAVDFPDLTQDEDNNTESVDEMPIFQEDPEEYISTKELRKQTQTFSSWHYSPSPEQQQDARKTSDSDIEFLRLEYTVDKLEKDLRDPLCTRDHDEMREELKQAKRDLSRLKRKRRFGF